MSISDSMFLFEIVVKELQSYINYHDFSIVTEFADLFSLHLKNPNEIDVAVPKRLQKKFKRKKVRDSKEHKITADHRARLVQSVLIPNNADLLMSSMKTCPMLLSLYAKGNLEYAMGSTTIPWSQDFIDYLNDLINNLDVPPVTVEGRYNVFDEISSKCMATILISIKLSCKDELTTQYRSTSEENSQTLLYSGFDSEPTMIYCTPKQHEEAIEETGIIKTIYPGGKKFKVPSKNKKSKLVTRSMHTHSKPVQHIKEITNLNRSTEIDRSKELLTTEDTNNENIDLVKNDTNLEVNKQVALINSKSYSSLEYESHLNTLNYIFGDNGGCYGNQVYCVGFFTVQNDNPSKGTVNAKSSEGSESKEKFKFKICDSECPSKKATGTHSHCSLDLPADAAPLISITKCDHVACDAKEHRKQLPPRDDRILIDFSSRSKSCCDFKTKGTEKVEQVIGGMTAKMKIGNDPCYCTCECRFGFTKKTTFCNICGGYELAGDELSRRPQHDMPFPCPVFHKLTDKKKKPMSPVTSAGKKKNVIAGEPEKENKKGKKAKKDDRFKFNYGYQAPKIGHSQCAMPCTGALGNVPKNMGWLWTADAPGMKFRPNWKPGATSKHVVRLLRLARNPDEVQSKKRRKEAGKSRPPLKRPLLIVHKKDGEYTVTMETMKTYARPRALNQPPYEEKPVVTYTIGRSEEENRERRKKKERAQRRLERAQRHFIQSAFKDMCEDICLKTYQQALGILPDTEDPECKCYPAEPGADRTNLDVSCSCSEDSTSLGSATDSDEWIVEFTPPNALFVPTFKGKKLLKVDNSSQYTYLDYRVKKNDRSGNPVSRFFKGPDGKQQCSDLGGFWGPDHKWLEINVDGFIAPDNRWAPNIFTGPSGEQVDGETGKFQTTNGNWLVIGVDGYVDGQGKWRYYQRPRGSSPQKKSPTSGIKSNKNRGDERSPVRKPSGATWSCFGEASPKDIGKMGFTGHGLDRKLLLATLQQMLSRGEDVIIPKPSTVPRLPESKRKKLRIRKGDGYDPWDLIERTKCRHPVPSEKGIVAVDARGNKTYFRLKDYKNRRPKERLSHLTHQGISLSSFHVPCFHSFINSEIMRQQQRERMLALAAQNPSVSTQANYRH